MKLGVIRDGISRNSKHAVDVVDEFNLDYAEQYFVDDTGVGDHSEDEIKVIYRLLWDRRKPVSCLSRHIFAGMTIDNEPGDELHPKHLYSLMRVIEMAHSVGSLLIRIIFNKEKQIRWGKWYRKMARGSRCFAENPITDSSSL